MRKEYFLGIGFFIIALGGFFYFKIAAGQNSPPPIPSPSPQPTITPPSVSANQGKIQEEDSQQRYSIDIQYPVFHGLNDANQQDEVNLGIKTLMDKEVQTFKKEVLANTIPEEFENAQNLLKGTYDISQTDDSRISVQFKVMDAQIGAAHPNNYNLVYNYDIKEKKTLQLKDVFQPNTNYLTRLSDLAKEDLLVQQKEDPNASDFVNTGASAKAANFSLFLFTSDSFILLFNPATVAPDYVGTMKVTIPFEKITNILSPQILSPS